MNYALQPYAVTPEESNPGLSTFPHHAAIVRLDLSKWMERLEAAS